MQTSSARQMPLSFLLFDLSSIAATATEEAVPAK